MSTLKKAQPVGLSDPIAARKTEGQLAQASLLAHGQQIVSNSELVKPYTTVAATSNSVTSTTSTTTNIAGDTTTIYTAPGSVYVSSIDQTIRNITMSIGVTSITAGNNITVSNSTGDITISATGGAGTSGYSGYSGAAGASGISGYSGSNGATGASGYSGIDGVSGYSGWSGTNGAAGASGISGYSGDTGSAGVSGYSGYSGATGSTGISGYSGYSGAGSAWIGYQGVDAITVPGTIVINNSYAGRLIYVNDAVYGSAGTWTLSLPANTAIVEGTVIGTYNFFNDASTLQVAPTGNVMVFKSGNLTPITSPSTAVLGNGKQTTLTKLVTDTISGYDVWILNVTPP